ncbi:hypothetical protein M514_06835 [Trichuris suis]|uniref:Uncharacterized protein n=1 Tax=Trichuris suis TaxID=68888 RepID=A0A085NB89_9BILA|nr:hypothetical protein M513_06835 [Trichuris suis]KFD66735.1 hypothetical protein M514_06835 [Trichuris suis]KHJ41697.1 hypothetical protein D918_08227 [Trichuris suis]
MSTPSDPQANNNNKVRVEKATTVVRSRKYYHYPSLMSRLDKLPLTPTEKEAILNRAKAGVDPNTCPPIIINGRGGVTDYASFRRQAAMNAMNEPTTTKKQCATGRSDVIELEKIKYDLEKITGKILEALESCICLQATAKVHEHE